MIFKPSDLTFADKKVRMLIAGYPGIGKALANGTGVLTPDWFKPIETLSVGDMVYGEDGLPHVVRGVFPQGVRPTYIVRFNDGATIQCDEEHLWTVRASTGNSAKLGWRTLTTRELLDRGIHCDSPSRKRTNRKPLLRWRVPIATAYDGPEREFVIPPYLMGVLLGDGCTSNGKPVFVNPERDAEIVDRVRAELPAKYDLSMYVRNIPHYYIKCDGRDNPIAQEIRNYGLDTTAGQKHIPHEYMTASRQQRLDLLRGLMDTDGSATRNRVTFCTTSCQLAEGVRTLVQSLGGLARVHGYDRSEEGKPYEYHVQIRLGYCPFYLKRKADEWSPSPYNRLIVSIERSLDAECTCIMVDNPTGLFVTENFVVTHNTTLALSAPKPLYIDVDLSAERIERSVLDLAVGVTQPKDYKELKTDLGMSGSVERAREELADVETIVIDTGGKLLTIMGQYGLTLDPKYGQRDGSLSLKGYGWLGKEFQRFLDHIIYNLDKHVVIVFHTVEEKDGDETRLRIKAEGSTKNNVWEVMDLGGFMEMRGQDRVIGFSNCERYFAKGTKSVHGVYTIPELKPGDKNDFLTRLFADYNAGSAAEAAQAAQERKAYDKAMAMGASILDSVQDAESANSAMPDFKAITHALTSQKELGAAWNARIKELGLVYDKALGKYAPAPPKEEEGAE